MTSFALAWLVVGMVTLFLYHVIFGKGAPVAEQLTRTDSLMPEALISSGGGVVNEGGSSRGKTHLSFIVSYTC